jgi:hypothetical protein
MRALINRRSHEGAARAGGGFFKYERYVFVPEMKLSGTGLFALFEIKREVDEIRDLVGSVVRK